MGVGVFRPQRRPFPLDSALGLCGSIFPVGCSLSQCSFCPHFSPSTAPPSPDITPILILSCC